jgi:copper chaperone CopZ
MKTKVVSLITMFVFAVFAVSATEVTKKFEVKGEDDCEMHIESAVKSVEGVSQAEWDEENHQLEVVYNDAETDLKKIQMAVAKAGHDTPEYKAKDVGAEPHKYKEKEHKDKEHKDKKPDEKNEDEW